MTSYLLPLPSLFRLCFPAGVKKNLLKAIPLDKHHKLPPLANTKIEVIRQFVAQKLQKDASNITFRVDENDLDDGYCLGSLKTGHALMIFSKTFADSLVGTLTNSQKFTIAQLYGHFMNDTGVEGILKIRKYEDAATLCTYAVTAAALTSLSFGILSSHLLSCGTAYIVKTLVGSRLRRQRELDADRYAASQGVEIAQGGINTLNILRSRKIDMTNKFLERWDFSKKIVHWLLFTREGDLRLFDHHPTIDQEIDVIKAAQSNVSIV